MSEAPAWQNSVYLMRFCETPAAPILRLLVVVPQGEQTEGGKDYLCRGTKVYFADGRPHPIIRNSDLLRRGRIFDKGIIAIVPHDQVSTLLDQLAKADSSDNLGYVLHALTLMTTVGLLQPDENCSYQGAHLGPMDPINMKAYNISSRNLERAGLSNADLWRLSRLAFHLEALDMGDQWTAIGLPPAATALPRWNDLGGAHIAIRSTPVSSSMTSNAYTSEILVIASGSIDETEPHIELAKAISRVDMSSWDISQANLSTIQSARASGQRAAMADLKASPIDASTAEQQSPLPVILVDSYFRSRMDSSANSNDINSILMGPSAAAQHHAISSPRNAGDSPRGHPGRLADPSSGRMDANPPRLLKPTSCKPSSSPPTPIARAPRRPLPAAWSSRDSSYQSTSLPPRTSSELIRIAEDRDSPVPSASPSPRDGRLTDRLEDEGIRRTSSAGSSLGRRSDSNTSYSRPPWVVNSSLYPKQNDSSSSRGPSGGVTPRKSDRPSPRQDLQPYVDSRETSERGDSPRQTSPHRDSPRTSEQSQPSAPSVSLRYPGDIRVKPRDADPSQQIERLRSSRVPSETSVGRQDSETSGRSRSSKHSQQLPHTPQASAKTREATSSIDPPRENPLAKSSSEVSERLRRMDIQEASPSRPMQQHVPRSSETSSKDRTPTSPPKSSGDPSHSSSRSKKPAHPTSPAASSRSSPIPPPKVRITPASGPSGPSSPTTHGRSPSSPIPNSAHSHASSSARSARPARPTPSNEAGPSSLSPSASASTHTRSERSPSTPSDRPRRSREAGASASASASVGADAGAGVGQGPDSPKPAKDNSTVAKRMRQLERQMRKQKK